MHQYYTYDAHGIMQAVAIHRCIWNLAYVLISWLGNDVEKSSEYYYQVTSFSNNFDIRSWKKVHASCIYKLANLLLLSWTKFWTTFLAIIKITAQHVLLLMMTILNILCLSSIYLCWMWITRIQNFVCVDCRKKKLSLIKIIYFNGICLSPL